MNKLKEDNKDKWQKMLDLLSTLPDIPGIFEKADLKDHHSFIREVFKHPLTYKDGMCRTHTINPAFAHNLLKIKAKRLPDIEQPLPDLSINPMCTRDDTDFQTLYEDLKVSLHLIV